MLPNPSVHRSEIIIYLWGWNVKYWTYNMYSQIVNINQILIISKMLAVRMLYIITLNYLILTIQWSPYCESVYFSNKEIRQLIWNHKRYYMIKPNFLLSGSFYHCPLGRWETVEIGKGAEDDRWRAGTGLHTKGQLHSGPFGKHWLAL